MVVKDTEEAERIRRLYNNPKFKEDLAVVNDAREVLEKAMKEKGKTITEPMKESDKTYLEFLNSPVEPMKESDKKEMKKVFLEFLNSPEGKKAFAKLHSELHEENIKKSRQKFMRTSGGLFE
ncbi:MAG: hypothetical protein LUP99_06215 [Methanomicrobiales archaeon]|nr:hypothetical protein [Methanomicrobiales archaeon]